MTILSEKLDQIEQYYTNHTDQQGLLKILERIAFEKRSPGSGTVITSITASFYAQSVDVTGKMASLDDISFLKKIADLDKFEFVDEEIEACFAARFVVKNYATKLPTSMASFFTSNYQADIFIKKCCDILLERNEDNVLKAKLHPQEQVGFDWMVFFKKLDCCKISSMLSARNGYTPLK